MRIWYLTPFCPEKRLGHIHNEYCKIVPNDDWICILDPDTMFLHPHQQKWIEDIVRVKGNDWDLLGCMTNRVGVESQLSRMHLNIEAEINPNEWSFKTNDIHLFNEINILTHVDHAEMLFKEHEYKVQQTQLIAGFFMIFKKSLWNKIKFEESIQFDMKFCNAVKKAGGKIGIMKGIYLFHGYRLGHKNPKQYKEHLL